MNANIKKKKNKIGIRARSQGNTSVGGLVDSLSDAH